ncbi:hypothetical protein MSAN_01994800 [Mycena sanguinolenta]|uniref:Uncharacterized protein n=1 Tax=Mycena sanguinolenta TaxID=230812 RepID=A0A8H7CNV0_9AGAR|nr:hypothetical protein MSAN_01994800 [Mycena sanguinolenta]
MPARGGHWTEQSCEGSEESGAEHELECGGTTIVCYLWLRLFHTITMFLHAYPTRLALSFPSLVLFPLVLGCAFLGSADTTSAYTHDAYVLPTRRNSSSARVGQAGSACILASMAYSEPQGISQTGGLPASEKRARRPTCFGCLQYGVTGTSFPPATSSPSMPHGVSSPSSISISPPPIHSRPRTESNALELEGGVTIIWESSKSGCVPRPRSRGVIAQSYRHRATRSQVPFYLHHHDHSPRPLPLPVVPSGKRGAGLSISAYMESRSPIPFSLPSDTPSRVAPANSPVNGPPAAPCIEIERFGDARRRPCRLLCHLDRDFRLGKATLGATSSTSDLSSTAPALGTINAYIADIRGRTGLGRKAKGAGVAIPFTHPLCAAARRRERGDAGLRRSSRPYLRRLLRHHHLHPGFRRAKDTLPVTHPHRTPRP